MNIITRNIKKNKFKNGNTSKLDVERKRRIERSKNKNIRKMIIEQIQGRPQDLGGGGPRNFFFRFGNLHVAKRHAAHGEAMRIARGVRGHAPPRKFFKTVQFGAF